MLSRLYPPGAEITTVTQKPSNLMCFVIMVDAGPFHFFLANSASPALFGKHPVEIGYSNPIPHLQHAVFASSRRILHISIISNVQAFEHPPRPSPSSDIPPRVSLIGDSLQPILRARLHRFGPIPASLNLVLGPSGFSSTPI